MPKKLLYKGEKLAKKVLGIIRQNPRIRPSRINKLLNIEHSWNIGSKLIRKGLIRKEKKGSEVHHYAKK